MSLMDAASGSMESTGKDQYLFVVSESRVFRMHLDVGRLINKDGIPLGMDNDPIVPLEEMKVSSPCGFDGYNCKIPICMTQVIDSGPRFATWLVGGFLKGHLPIPNFEWCFEVNPSEPLIYSDNVSFFFPYLTPFMLNALTKQHIHTYQFGSSLYVLDLTDSHKMKFSVDESMKFSADESGNYRGLSDPPLSEPYQVVNQTMWANKIHIHVRPTVSSVPYMAYTFNLSTETWVGGNDQVLAAVEYKGFLIALLASGVMVSYGRDSCGCPIGTQNMLYDMFDICMLSWLHHFEAEKAFMGLFKDGDDDFIWLAYKVQDSSDMFFVLLRVCIIMGWNGNPVLSAIVEASHQYSDVDCFLCNVFTCST